MVPAVGEVVSGKVTGITKFGAFVDIGNGHTGMVHISEIADEYITEISDHLKMGDIVNVKVININGEKVGLSIKQTLPSFIARQEARNRARDASNMQNFEDKLAKFMKDSEERHSDLRKSQDSKRGGRGSRGSRMF
ncbi:MAG TPA: S1 RNA-binding domain-containing protein [Bacillota bacterium]|nr:MAG: General stress protein 13 [Firmicutes bacterium ADurb.Bin153]HNV33945.1 S1 RNA-binding domain-containing protein [Bacillota bacterium]HPU95477.1 S1 RNA-binding domain-containing protein [Bacillota bacterium]